MDINAVRNEVKKEKNEVRKFYNTHINSGLDQEGKFELRILTALKFMGLDERIRLASQADGSLFWHEDDAKEWRKSLDYFDKIKELNGGVVLKEIREDTMKYFYFDKETLDIIKISDVKKKNKIGFY